MRLLAARQLQLTHRQHQITTRLQAGLLHTLTVGFVGRLDPVELIDWQH